MTPQGKMKRGHLRNWPKNPNFAPPLETRARVCFNEGTIEHAYTLLRQFRAYAAIRTWIA